MSASVGRSHRTPAKHALMWKIAGREIGAAGQRWQIQQLRYLDLTAGDGLADESAPGGWEHNCSPGIAAYHARNSRKPIEVILYEIQAATFDRLTRNLAERLPGLGYRRDGDEWICGNARLRLVHGSGARALTAGITTQTAVLVSNDPNAITDWAMRPSFAAEIRHRTPWFRAISTMGCNPAGLKRLPPEERQVWFEHIEKQAQTLPNHHDLLLVEIQKDDAQWAYLLCEPVKWRKQAERDALTAFGAHGLSVNWAWWKTENSQFAEIERRLFLTKKERSA